MNKKTDALSLCFDEKGVAKEITLFDINRRKVYKRHIQNKSYQIYYQFITQYLISLNLSVEKIKSAIRKHIALTIYLIENEKRNGKWGKYIDYSVKEFDEQLKKEQIDIDFLLADDDNSYSWIPFKKLFYSKDFELIKEGINELNGFFAEEYVESLLKIVLDYFYFGCQFAEIKYYNHTDLLIPYAFSDGKFDLFSFKAEDDYKDNYCSTVSFKKDIQEIVKGKVLGHIINIIFINNNLDLNKDMEIKPRYYYEIMFNMYDKKIIKDAYYFFEIDFAKQIAWVDKTKIKKPFNFIYNGQKYNFSREGIKKYKTPICIAYEKWL